MAPPPPPPTPRRPPTRKRGRAADRAPRARRRAPPPRERRQPRRRRRLRRHARRRPPRAPRAARRRGRAAARGRRRRRDRRPARRRPQGCERRAGRPGAAAAIHEGGGGRRAPAGAGGGGEWSDGGGSTRRRRRLLSRRCSSARRAAPGRGRASRLRFTSSAGSRPSSCERATKMVRTRMVETRVGGGVLRSRCRDGRCAREGQRDAASPRRVRRAARFARRAGVAPAVDPTCVATNLVERRLRQLGVGGLRGRARAPRRHGRAHAPRVAAQLRRGAERLRVGERVRRDEDPAGARRHGRDRLPNAFRTAAVCSCFDSVAIVSQVRGAARHPPRRAAPRNLRRLRPRDGVGGGGGRRRRRASSLTPYFEELRRERRRSAELQMQVDQWGRERTEALGAAEARRQQFEALTDQLSEAVEDNSESEEKLAELLPAMLTAMEARRATALPPAAALRGAAPECMRLASRRPFELQFEDAFVETPEKLNERLGRRSSSYAQLHLLRRLVSDRGGALVNGLAAPDRLARLGELLSQLDDEGRRELLLWYSAENAAAPPPPTSPARRDRRRRGARLARLARRRRRRRRAVGNLRARVAGAARRAAARARRRRTAVPRGSDRVPERGGGAREVVRVAAGAGAAPPSPPPRSRAPAARATSLERRVSSVARRR